MALKLVWSSYLLTVALALGCNNRSLSFGDDPGVLWWTDHETGDLSDWLGKSAAGGYILTRSSRVEVGEGPVRSGTDALRINHGRPNHPAYPLAAPNTPSPLGVQAR